MTSETEVMTSHIPFIVPKNVFWDANINKYKKIMLNNNRSTEIKPE